MSLFSTPPQHQTDPAKAPGVVKNDITLSDYIKRLQQPVVHGDPTGLYDRGWNAALEAIDKFIETVYPVDVFNDNDAGKAEAYDKVTQVLDKEKK